MQEQDPKVRATNFGEVACGYTLEDALREADRCLMCPDEPCIRGCPVEIDIPAFIMKITEKSLRGAYETITDTNLLPAICGRVCPQESQCEGACTVGETLEPVAIGRLERFVGDLAIAEGWASVPYVEPSGLRVAVVGSGPAGMACAADLAKAGCDVTVYEAFHEPGGVLKYGIPDFRLPNEVIDAEIEKLRALGVKFECNTLVGRLFTVEELLTELDYQAVFIGTGAGAPSFMGIPGESLAGVMSANELLTRCNLMHAQGLSGLRHAASGGQASRRHRRRKHRDGRDAGLPASGRRIRLLRLPADAQRGAGPRRRASPRGGRGHRLPLADESRRDPRRRGQQRARDPLPADGAG